MLTEHDKLAISAAYYEDGLRDGIEKGREEGREEGRTETITQITARLSAMGMTPEQIRDIIGDEPKQKKG